jgi:hypothetical protein
VNLIGLLSWFDEPTDSLLTCLAAMAQAGTDHIVAVDGRYALYNADHDQSDPNEYAAIILACRELGMGCTIHQPSGPFRGGEVEKRTFLFALGLSVACESDWFWVQDADQVVMHVPDDLKDRLAATEHDAAEVTMLDVVAQQANVPNWPATFVLRCLFRAQPITVGPAHCQYRAADGSLLWGYESDGAMADALDLSEHVLVEHRPQNRPQDRLHAKLTYYAERDAAGVERGRCELCGDPAVSIEPTRWRITEIGPVADWMECCAVHRESVRVVNAVELRKLGINPESVVVGSLNGRAPERLAGDAAGVALRRHTADVR